MARIIDLVEQFTISTKELGFNAVIALIILVFGILLGKFIKLILKRASKKFQLDKIFESHGIEVVLTIIKWTVYIFFIGFAIEQLDIPYLSTSFADAVSIIPKSIGALTIIVLGYVLARFFQKNIVRNSSKEWFLLGYLLYHFLIYLSLLFSIQLIFVGNDFLSNWISVIITVFYLLFIVLFYTRKK